MEQGKKHKNDMNPDLANLRDELDKANNFIDYFLEIGLPPEVAFNDWLYEATPEELNIAYPEKMKPKIISSFPPFMKRSIAYDDSIIKHVFPNGFKIIESSEKPKSELFSFMLDNNFFSIQFPQKYLSCLIFYENIQNYKTLYTKNKELIKLHSSSGSTSSYRTSASSTAPISHNLLSSPNLSSTTTIFSNQKNKAYYIPKCLMIISLHPFFGEFEKILTKIYEFSKKKIIDITIDKIIENLVIEVPVPPRGIFNVKYNLIDDEEKDREIKQTLMNDLPLISVDLKILFDYFTVENIVDIYRYIILESRVLFFSSDIALLNPFLYGLVSLLYPFTYQYQIVTILPKENFETIESITPFLAGINESYNINFFEEKNLCLCDAIVVVDIDNRKILKVYGEGEENNMEEKKSKKKEEDICPEFPKSPKRNLEKTLSNLISQLKKQQAKLKKNDEKQRNKDSICKKNVDDKNKINTTTNSNKTPLTTGTNNNEEEETKEDFDLKDIDFAFNKSINNSFFLFNCNLLQNYNKFLNEDFYSSKGQPDLLSLFKFDDFLNTIGSNEKQFYSKFLSETQIFGDFLYKRMIPKDSNERLQVLPFEEKINEITSSMFNKNEPGIFINSEEYKFINKFSVPKHRALLQNEIEYFKNTQNAEKLIKYGIIIEKSKNKDNLDSVNFKFPIFPLLTSDIFFLQNLKEYFIPQVLTEEISNINADIVSKSHLGKIKLAQSDMSNYIYLCWMMLWAMCLWYVKDEDEKEHRFKELRNLLDKVVHNEIEVYNLLMDSLSKYGNDIMIFDLYELIIERKIAPSQIIRDTVMKVVDKKQFRGLSEKNFLENLKKIKQEKIKSKSDQKKAKNFSFKKRTFKNKYDTNILGEDIFFNAFDFCVTCQQHINLEKASLNFNEMQRDILWAKCTGCGSPLLPKVTIRFGKEMNKLGKLEINTSSVYNTVLFSPQSVKENLSNMLVKEYGTHLDIDDFKMKYSSLYWNCLWYFQLKHLDYKIFLPYEHNLEPNVLSTLRDNLSTTTSQFENFGKEEKKNKTKKFEFCKLQECSKTTNIEIVSKKDGQK